jgi:hypothetical protein
MSDVPLAKPFRLCVPDTGVVGEYQASGCPGRAEDQSLLYAPTHNQK